MILPTLTPAGDAPTGSPLHKVSEKDRENGLLERARIVDGLLVNASQDLGLSLDLAARNDEPPPNLRDTDILELAATVRGWVISPRIEKDGSHYILRIVAVAPGTNVLRVRVERVTSDQLQVRTLSMLRDLLSSTTVTTITAPQNEQPTAAHDPSAPARSPGRAVLSVGTAAFGGFSGLALQRAGRSDDPRLLYPLLALGTGVGLGAATIIADEWDVGYGDAWYLTAGTWWPTTTTLLLSAGYNVQPTGDRYAFSLLSGLGGAGLASAALSRGHMSEGGGALGHSGGAIGAFIGGATQMIVGSRPPSRRTRGLGFRRVRACSPPVSPPRSASSSRVLLIDVGAGLRHWAEQPSRAYLCCSTIHPPMEKPLTWAVSGRRGCRGRDALPWWPTGPTPRVSLLKPNSVFAIASHAGRDSDEHPIHVCGLYGDRGQQWLEWGSGAWPPVGRCLVTKRACHEDRHRRRASNHPARQGHR
ncbi:MAG: hypothetical protein U0165_00605 [Polyangiaceae bacterium]